MPSVDFLNIARTANPHGCGYCTPKKSFKTLDYDIFLEKLNKIKKDTPVLIHFRYATHGRVRQSNCHPFYDRDLGVKFMHNGILNITPFRGKTDSETAFRSIIVPEIAAHGIESTEVDESINSVIGVSRFAIMQGDTVKLYGQWYEHNGLMLSNNRLISLNK